MKHSISILICAVIFMASCSSKLGFQKRRYNRGIYISTAHHPDKPASHQSKRAAAPPAAQEPVITAAFSGPETIKPSASEAAPVKAAVSARQKIRPAELIEKISARVFASAGSSAIALTKSDQYKPLTFAKKGTEKKQSKDPCDFFYWLDTINMVYYVVSTLLLLVILVAYAVAGSSSWRW